MGVALFAVCNRIWLPDRVYCTFIIFFTQISVDAMKSDVDEISLQGIEFWSNVCDEEIALAIESEEVTRMFWVL